MAFPLDAPTVFRTGAPTLGVPVITLPVPASPEDLLTPLLSKVSRQELRIANLETAVAYLIQPWYRRLWFWLTGWRLTRQP